jgi:hypothetical protein
LFVGGTTVLWLLVDMLRRLVFSEVASPMVALDDRLLCGVEATLPGNDTRGGLALVINAVEVMLVVSVIMAGRVRPRSGIGGVDNVLIEFKICRFLCSRARGSSELEMAVEESGDRALPLGMTATLDALE